jgi:alkylhydroperoxidase/carboxymuconolactone decarboxylase family protein YurZ
MPDMSGRDDGREVRQLGDAEALKAEFVASHGYWDDDLKDLLAADLHYFRAYAQLLGVPARTNRLPARDRELISVAINAAATHLNREAVRLHVANALRAGASPEEVIEACQLASVLGTHTMSIGVPILIDELRAAGRGAEVEFGELTSAQRALEERFRTDRGYWASHWEAILHVAPEYFEAYLDFSSVPWLRGTLDPKLREFIYTAIDVSTTHLYELGIRVHLRNAFKHGATFAEIIDVMIITSLLGLQSSTHSIPEVMAAVRRQLCDGQGTSEAEATSGDREREQ